MDSKEVVIRLENVGKQYRLGQVGTGTLSHDVQRWWAKARGKEDPYLKVGVENDRTKVATGDYAWALQDISFDIEQGDTLGIIGKNGAGKSTLLKLLSRVTAPSTGEMKIRGRIASLLEVGTGFHPELSGRENIYLNGAILGMTRKEIDRKFDEIVSFAGVEMYIDTPVKRYSSGMYVRLAFGVAAHLEPEILIVDEVLAVGDAEFQKKCLGKMSDVASHGRTILFVSHNMQAVQSLCKKVLYLKSGRVVEIGATDKVINNYLSKEVKNCLSKDWTEEDAPGNKSVSLRSAKINVGMTDLEASVNEMDIITVNTPFSMDFSFFLHKEININISFYLHSATGTCIFNYVTTPKLLAPGHHTTTLKVPGRLLNDDLYTVSILFVKDTTTHVFQANDVLSFEVVDLLREGSWYGKWLGAIRPTYLEFTLD